MEAPPYVAVARVVTTHGIQGELSVAPTTSYEIDELVGKEIWLAPPVRIARPRQVVAVRPGPKGPLMKLEGIDDIECAAEAIGCAVLLPPTLLPAEVLEGEWDALGYHVRDATRGDIGEVIETIVTGANDVWVVRGPLGEVLIPVIEDVVMDVDDDTQMIEVELLPGLIEDDS